MIVFLCDRCFISIFGFLFWAHLGAETGAEPEKSLCRVGALCKREIQGAISNNLQTISKTTRGFLNPANPILFFFLLRKVLLYSFITEVTISKGKKKRFCTMHGFYWERKSMKRKGKKSYLNCKKCVRN